jgi:hypothetical protein
MLRLVGLESDCERHEIEKNVDAESGARAL